MADTCTTNRYTWYKNGNWFIWDNPESSHTITYAQVSHSGTYTCRVSNPSQCSGVFLWRKAIHLTVSSSTNIQPQPISNKHCSISYRFGEQILDISFHFAKEINATADLYDECGRIVLRLYDEATSQQNFHQYVGWMKKGLYIVRIVTKDEEYTSKITVH